VGIVSNQLQRRAIRLRLVVLAAAALNMLPQLGHCQPINADNNAPGKPTDPGPTNSPTPPAWQQFQLHQDTPAERETILIAREKSTLAKPPQQIAPLPEQKISPNTPNP
jgi:hypothetical protein